MPDVPTSHNSAWEIKNFRLYTYTGLLLPFASQMQSLVIGWQVYQIKHDPIYLGLIGLVEAVPAISLALVAGYLVDKNNPVTVYKNVLILALATALMLLLISLPQFAESETRIIFLYLAAFLGGVGRGFRMPANTAIVPQLVPREVLHISSAWSSTAYSVAAASGPAVGGALYAWQGAILPFAVDAFFLATALVLFLRIKMNYIRPEVAITHKVISGFENLTAGLRYVFSKQLLLGALTLDMLAVLFGGVVALLPIFAGDILKVGASGLGVLSASDSVGAMIGGVILIRYPVREHSGKILFAAVAGFGLCMIAFGLSTSFWLSAAVLALSGAFDSVSRVIRGTIVQLSAPPQMRGRVGAVNSVFIGVSNQLGEFESGVAAKFLGVVPSVVFGGIATLIVVAVTAMKAPELREMELHKL
jgi:MFS family permease